MEIVEVTWLDAGLESKQMTIDEAKTLSPMVRVNVGYLLHKAKDKLILCGGFIEDLDCEKKVCDQNLVLPIGMVQNIKKLK